MRANYCPLIVICWGWPGKGRAPLPMEPSTGECVSIAWHWSIIAWTLVRKGGLDCPLVGESEVGGEDLNLWLDLQGLLNGERAYRQLLTGWVFWKNILCLKRRRDLLVEKGERELQPMEPPSSYSDKWLTFEARGWQVTRCRRVTIPMIGEIGTITSSFTGCVDRSRYGGDH